MCGSCSDEALFGTNFNRALSAYVIAPEGWFCGTLQGGTGMTVTTAPTAVHYPHGPTTEIASVANYDGAGGNFLTSCDWFRWAAERFDAFSTRRCGRSYMSSTVEVTP